MARNIGDRYVCEKCGAVLVYEKGCPCPEGDPHSEICCGVQMKRLAASAREPVGAASRTANQ